MAELATIVRQYRGALLERRGFLHANQIKALDAIENCRSDPDSVVGSYCSKCDQHHRMLASCKNRHCPKCQYEDGVRWCKKQVERLLPVTYFMVTFTVPAQLRKMMQMNQKEAYAAFFEAVKNSLDIVGADPKYLGGKYGYIAVLHTWARNLGYHPHVHCIVPGGAFDEENNLWRKSTQEFLFYVPNLSKIFKQKLFEALQRRGLIRNLPQGSFKREIVVNCKAVDKGDRALEYLGRYIFRTALSNQSILKLENDQVTFRYRESKTEKLKTETMHAVDFLELYIAHILPDNFMKVRTYGLIHHSNHLLLDRLAVILNWKRPDPHFEERPSNPCPKCGHKMLMKLLYVDKYGERRCKQIISLKEEVKPP